MLLDFTFLPGIKQNKQNLLINSGINDWNSFIKTKKIKYISDKQKSKYNKTLKSHLKSLHNYDSSGLINYTQPWQLYDFFKDDILFLDIETTGINGQLIMIGLFDGYSYQAMISNLNFDLIKLKEYLSRFKLLITFNGSVFDIPFLKKRYPDLIPSIPHIDLRFLSSKLNLHGSLKSIEKQLNIHRSNPIVDNMYGGDPTLLWRKFHATGDKYFLDLLIEYNEEDTVNLNKIMDYCFNNLNSRSI